MYNKRKRNRLSDYDYSQKSVYFLTICTKDRKKLFWAEDNIIKQYKGYVTKKLGFSPWQKSFHDYIVRSRDEYLKIFEYIQTNSLKWNIDKYYEE